MKKVFVATAFGTLLLAGFFFVNDQPTDLAMDLEPEVTAIEQPSYQF
ncbi:hypothetical protein [Virgibacillus sp. Bac332]|nr:hypothetical protein [Virgibacillus sp. Bac332]